MAMPTTELGLPDEAIPKVVCGGLSEEQKLEHVLRLNLLRRHLTREQKRALAVQLRQRGWTRDRIPAVLGVSQQTVSNLLRDVTKTGNVDAESGRPRCPRPSESAEVWAYLRACLPEHLPEPGPLDTEADARALAFEGALAVLGRVVRELEEARRVVGTWRRWREHHGDTKAPHDGVRVLWAAANHLEKALAQVGTSGSGPSQGRQVQEG